MTIRFSFCRLVFNNFNWRSHTGFIKYRHYTSYIKLLNNSWCCFDDKNVYNWANQYSKKTKYHSLSQHYALLAIANTIDYLSLNEKVSNKELHKIFYINI